jgi:hypothetical protein
MPNPYSNPANPNMNILEDSKVISSLIAPNIKT